MAQLEGIPAGLWRSKSPALADLGMLVPVYGMSHSQLCTTVESLEAKSRFAQRKEGRKREGERRGRKASHFPRPHGQVLCFLLVLQFHTDVSGRDGNITHVCGGRHLREWDEPCEENPLFGVRRNFPEVPQT